MSNKVRMDEVAGRSRESLFRLGERVRRKDFGDDVGVIDAMYVDFKSATDSQAVPTGWYELQEVPLRTPKEGRFYSLILVNGAILAGEDDLERVA